MLELFDLGMYSLLSLVENVLLLSFYCMLDLFVFGMYSLFSFGDPLTAFLSPNYRNWLEDKFF